MSSGNGAGPLVPTFHGFVSNSMDGLILFEACLSGKLHHVPRRPHDRERSQLIKSGSIFIYEENASGIKRWTDGVAWSPSRILGNFLIYRELEKPFPPGEKKRAMKRKRTSMPGEPYPRRDSEETENVEIQTPLTPPTPGNANSEVKTEAPASEQEKDMERHLIGSLVDSYGFRSDGLVKKTMSVSISGVSHHMVSYYKVDDVKNQLLPSPRSDPRLAGISPRPELYMKQNFRAPIEETEHYALDGHMHASVMYSSMGGMPYAMRQGQYFAPHYPVMYGNPPSSTPGMYGGVSSTAWQSQPPPPGSVPYPPPHQSYGSQSYPNYYKSQEQPPAPSVKTESTPQTVAQAIPYGSSYSTPYSGMQRSSSQATPSMMQPSYPPTAHQSPAAYGSMNAPNSRPPYTPTTMNTSTSSEHHSQPQVYGSGSTQQYAVRSPPQNYGIQNTPHSGVTQSPHAAVKSPPSGPPGTPAGSMGTDPNAQMHNSQVPYRPTASYAAPAASHPSHSSSDINGLGISAGSSYGSSAQTGQTYNYAPSGQAYRPVSEVASAAQGAPSYAQ